MSLSARSIAMQGLGSGVLFVALQGLVPVPATTPVVSGGGNWMTAEAEPAQNDARRKQRIRANNMMLIAALIAVATGEGDGSAS